MMIDRVACTGKGVCASVQPDAIMLDEWGYPIVDDARIDPNLIERTISMCPARAVYLATIGVRAPSPPRVTATTPTPTGRPVPVARPT
jgi:ferredoxin